MWKLIATTLCLSIGAVAQRPVADIVRDEFADKDLGPSWQVVRNLDHSHWSLTERPNFLRLTGSTVTLDDLEVPPVYVGQKIENGDFEATAQVDFDPKTPNETAGLVLRQNERQRYEFAIGRGANGREIFLRYVIGGVRSVPVSIPIQDGIVRLKIRGFPDYYRFSYSVNAGDFKEIGGVETKYLKIEKSPVFVGLFASGNGIESTAKADFDWFEYNSKPVDPYANIALNDPKLPPGYTIFSVDVAEKGIIKKYPFITRPDLDISTDIEFEKGLVYAKYGTREMHVDLYKPKKRGKYPAAIVVHGGAWITGHYTMEDPLALALAKRGYVAITVEHRLSNEKKYPAQIYDLKASVRWLRANAKKYDIDENRIGAVGGSSGGHLVALLGATNDMPHFEGGGGNNRFSSRVQSVVDIDGTATFVDEGNIAKEIKGPYNTNTTLTGFTYAQNPEV